ncbi:hypothetical protein CFP56_023197 [Quercus suber]|uniref:Uncharacterized protein n=1 Tax=Quercus suber TaxID=58331 RepID=A0AAW0K908_QUESU
MKILEQREPPSLEPHQMACIDEWRSLYMQKKPSPFFPSSLESEKASSNSSDLFLSIDIRNNSNNKYSQSNNVHSHFFILHGSKRRHRITHYCTDEDGTAKFCKLILAARHREFKFKISNPNIY